MRSDRNIDAHAGAAPEKARSKRFGSLHQICAMACELGSGKMSSLIGGETVEDARSNDLGRGFRRLDTLEHVGVDAAWVDTMHANVLGSSRET